MKNYEAKCEYEADFGTAKAGDYVVVVTNHTNASATIEPGIVMNDGYVVLGINPNGKPRRREIGAFGCPVCKIPKSTLTEEQIKIINSGVVVYNKKWDYRYFVVVRTTTEYQNYDDARSNGKPISNNIDVQLLKTKSLGNTTNEVVILDYLKSKVGDISHDPTSWRPVKIRSNWSEITKEGYDGWNAELKNRNQNK